jgi:hypothetical protein
MKCAVLTLVAVILPFAALAQHTPYAGQERRAAEERAEPHGSTQR